MAKKTTTVVEDDEPKPPEPVLVPDPEDEAPEDIEVRELLESLGADETATVHIYRQGTGGPRDLTLLARMTPAEFDPIMLAGEPYNGGVFRLHIRSKGGIAGNRVLKVAPNAKVGAGLSGAPTDRLAEIMAQGFTRLGELIVQRDAAQSRDPLASVEGIVGLVKQLMPAPSAGGVTDTLAQMKTMLEFSRLLNPPREGKVLNDDGDVNPNALLMKGLEVFGEAVSMRKGAEVAGVAQPAALPGQVAGAAVAGPGAPEPETDEMAFFKLQVRLAVKAAQSGQDAADFADSIYKLVPDEVLQQLALEANWFKVLTDAAPEAANYRGWFERVRQALIEYAREDGILTSAENAPNMPPATATAGANGDHSGGSPTNESTS